MNDRKKTKRKLFNIFEKDNICNSLNELNQSDVKTPTFNLKLTAKKRSSRLKSEIFVERIPPDSPENDPYALTKNDFEDTKLVYTPPKKKAKISKSPSFMERIDRYFNIQPSKASNTLSDNSCRTTSDATEDAEQKIGKTVHSKASNSPKLKEDDDPEEYGDSFIDSIDTNAIVDMLNNTEIVESQFQVKNENSNNIATPKKYDRKSNENLNPIVRLNSNERKVLGKENNNLQKRKAKSKHSKKNQNVVESPVDSTHTNAIIDSIDTNAIVEMLNNTEIVEEKSQVQNEISNCNTTPKKYHTSKERDTKPKGNFKIIVSLKTTEKKASWKENKSLQATKTRSKSTKKNQNDEECRNTLQLLRPKGRKGKFSACQLQKDDYVGSKNNDAQQQESLITEPSASLISSPEKSVENKISVSLRKRERRQTISSIQMDSNVAKTNSSQQLSVSLTSSPPKTIEKDRSVSLRKRSGRQTISCVQMDNNVAEVKENHDSCQFSAASLISSPQKSLENENLVSLRKRGRRQTISGIQKDNNVAEITETNKSSQFPAASLISSPPKSVENEKSASLQKRGRRPTISGIQNDNNVAEITETNDSSQLPSDSPTLSPQETAKNEISVPIRKRGRRQTICGIQMDNNVAEVTETSYSSQLPSASMTSSPQKSVESERSATLRKRGRRPTISGIQMDNNVAEITETNDSSQLPSASMTSSPQKSVENEISVPIRKRGRRPTISSTKMDNNVAEVTETNDSSQLPSASPTLSPQETVKNEISVPIRKRGRRQTVCGIQIDNNVAEVTETSYSSQLPSASMTSSPQKSVESERSATLRKRGRRPTISGIQMDNNVAEITETNDSSQLPSASMTSSPQKSVENERSITLRKRGRRPTISSTKMDNNVAEVTETNDSSQLPSASPTLSPQETVKNEISVPIRKRGRRQTVCGIQIDNNVAEVTETSYSSQLPSASMTSSPQKSVENEISVSLRKRGRQPTISIKIDNNVAEVTETNDSSQLPSALTTSSPQKTVKNEISVPIRKRGRRQTVCGIQIDNNVAKETETNESSQFTAASLISSPQKSVENERSVSLRKRGRRPTISSIQVNNNVAEITETKESGQYPAASLISSPQKSVENERSVSLRKRGRRPTISDIKMDNNVAEVTETNDSSQLPSASMTSSSQKTVEKEISVPIRKRGRRQTICGIQTDNNFTEVEETNDSRQLPRKRGRRPTICQTKLENYFTCEAKKTNESSLENQTEINSDENVTKRITINLNENDNISSMANNASDEQNAHTLPVNHKEKLPTGSQQVKNQSIKPQKIRSTDSNDNKVVEEPKRKRGRPRLSPNVAAEKQVKMRIQKINVAKKPKNTYGRLSKDKCNSANVRRIPKDRLDEVLDMLQNEDHEIWKDRNISCNAGIHRYWETRTMTSDQNMKMKYARQFLLRRDWLNLSKILCLSNQDAKNNIYYPLLVKYATLCLAHTDKEQFHKFVNSLITMADSSAIIKKCTRISRQNEE